LAITGAWGGLLMITEPILQVTPLWSFRSPRSGLVGLVILAVVALLIVPKQRHYEPPVSRAR
jgi:hypothetical protein